MFPAFRVLVPGSCWLVHGKELPWKLLGTRQVGLLLSVRGLLLLMFLYQNNCIFPFWFFEMNLEIPGVVGVVWERGELQSDRE